MIPHYEHETQLGYILHFLFYLLRYRVHAVTNMIKKLEFRLLIF